MTRALFRPAGLLVLAGTLIAGCRAETQWGLEYEIDPEEFRVVTDVPLAGRPLRISAPWFASAPDTIAVQIDGRETQAATRSATGNDEFELSLPADLSGGRHVLSLQSTGSRLTEIGRFESGGFEPQVRYFAVPRFVGSVQVLVSRPAIVGLESFTETPRLLDLRTGEIAYYEGLPSAKPYGLGSSYANNTFILPAYPGHYRIGVGVAGLWIDTAPLPYDHELVHELAPALHLRQANDLSDLTDATDSTWTSVSLYPYGHSDRVTFSPDGRWAVPDHSVSHQGVLVVDRNDRKYRWIPGWIRARTRLVDDSTLIVYGGGYGSADPRRLARIDVRTLAITVERPAGEGPSWLGMPGMVGGDRFFAVPVQVEGGWEVSIFDVESLEELTRVTSPTPSGKCLLGGEPWIVDDPTTHRFYVIDPYCELGAGIPMATFLLP